MISGSLVGATLAVSGVALQALLRNPLAEPFVLGLSSGAGVGVMAEMLLAYYLGWRVGGYETGAVLGAAATMAVVFTAGRRRGVLDPLGLLLVGVVLGTINGAIMMVLQYVYGAGTLRPDLTRWMMGYLNDQNITTATQGAVAALTLAGLAAAWWLGPAMDVATFSDSEAESLGVHLGRVRALLFVIASVLTAGSVTLAGPIAFVGLVCPHLVRLMLGPGHRNLLLGAAMTGAGLILLADAASAVLDRYFRVGTMPIGIFTAILGGPAFLWMLRPHLGRGVE
jgi:iron complex transport system permease protein